MSVEDHNAMDRVITVVPSFGFKMLASSSTACNIMVNTALFGQSWRSNKTFLFGTFATPQLRIVDLL